MTPTQQVLRTFRGRGRELAHRMPRLSGGAAAGVGFAVASVAFALLASRRQRSGRRRGRKIQDVMIHDVLTIGASATLMEAAQKMRDANVGVLPVVAEGHRLRGLITDRDLVVRAVAEGADPSTARVQECATRDLICAHPDSPVDEVLEVMAECQIGRLPVVDYDNRVIGIVTLSSLALRSRDQDEALHTAREVSKRSARAA